MSPRIYNPLGWRDLGWIALAGLLYVVACVNAGCNSCPKLARWEDVEGSEIAVCRDAATGNVAQNECCEK
jgi:hypothetical protein